MQHGRGLRRFQASRFALELHFGSEHSACVFRYRHVLVSTSLNVADRAAVLLGFELASLHQSALTLLHVQPRLQRQGPIGLDAIGLLHAAAEVLGGNSAARKPSAAAGHRLREFVDDIVPQRLQEAVNWRGQCPQGNVAETVVLYANESAADLVILPAKTFRWWLPVLPFAVRTIERRARANVIVIRSQETSPLS